MELGAQVAKMVWKGSIGHAEPKRHHQIQEALPIIRRQLVMVEVMSTHRTNRGLPITAKINVEVTQHHHLVNKEHDLQTTKQEQMKGILDESVRHIHGCIGHHHRHMLANNYLETN